MTPALVACTLLSACPCCFCVLLLPACVQGKKWYTGPPPDAPSYPELVSASDVSVKIKWTPPALPEAPPAESKAPGAPQPRAPKEFVYKVEYGYKYSVSSGWEVAANNVRVPKYTIEGLDPNTTYAARVYAKYAEGGEWGPPSASSWGLPTLTQAAAAEIRAEKEVRERGCVGACFFHPPRCSRLTKQPGHDQREHEAALKRSVAAVEEQRREQAAQRQRARTEELERALAYVESRQPQLLLCWPLLTCCRTRSCTLIHQSHKV